MAGTGKLFLSLFISLLSTSYGLQCLSKNGSPVDWFVVYKLPELRHIKDPILHEGQGFYYMDASHPELVLSHTGMNSSDHAVYYTLQQIYKNKSDIAYVMYNDQPPDTRPSLKHGHSKGTVGFDNGGGFWLVHSTPEFPPEKKNGYKWLERSCDFGQTFLCISMDYSVMDNLGHIFMYTYPKIYDYSIPEKFRGNNPVLSKVVSSPRHIKSPPWYNITQIVSKGHNKFISFEKFTDFHADLYDDLIARKMKENLLVETWRVHGASKDRLPSNCSVPYKVYNIDTLIFPDKEINFETSKDHSKWAVSQSQGDWLCIGDINRQKTQFKRGGTQVCFQNHRAWKTFKQLVNSTEPCDT